MYCSTCGSMVSVNGESCDACGTRLWHSLPERWGLFSRSASAGAARFGHGTETIGRCPRCAYEGEGLTYFSRGTHMAGLVVASLVTMGAFAIGGILYYAMRRDHVICPRCGLGWGRAGAGAIAPLRARAPAVPPASRFISRESVQRGWSYLLFLLTAILIIGGIVGSAFEPFLFAGGAAVGGVILHRSANRTREARRAALLASLQGPVLKLAAERGGRLTVSEAASQLGWTLKRAEKVLHSMDDGYRVSSEVTDEGLIVYEFLELVPRPQRWAELPGSAP